MMTVVREKPERMPVSTACRSLGLNRSSVYAWRRMGPPKPAQRSRKDSVQPKALSAAERKIVLDTMTTDAFKDQPPVAIYHQLLQDGVYLASVSTMHRLLRADKLNGERRHQRAPQHHAVPRLLAHAPNEVWTWDITKLPLTQRGAYLSLYVVMDLFSRYVVAWMLSRKENSSLAQQLMSEAVARYDIAPEQLTLHQDRGSPMTATSFIECLADRKITASHSRPRVSNDNAFSESQFKTAKYQPDYPGKFQSFEQARAWCVDYFDWYNTQHHHSGLAGFTPEQVFTGDHIVVATQKQAALDAMYRTHPERFVAGQPKVAMPPSVVAINPVPPELRGTEEDRVNFPTLQAARGN